MKKNLFLIRGLPGSGKSTLADRLVHDLCTNPEGHPAVKVEMDQFFGLGAEYSFDWRFLGAAHDECYGRCMRYLRDGYSVAVANNFSTRSEIHRYTRGLARCGLSEQVRCTVIKCIGEFRPRHDMSPRVIERLRARWEDVPGETVFNGEL